MGSRLVRQGRRVGQYVRYARKKTGSCPRSGKTVYGVRQMGGEGDKPKKMRWDGCQRKERGWKRTIKHIPWNSEVGDN